MNTKTIKLTSVAILAHLMCFTVILSHMHAKDAAMLLSQQSALSKLVTSDITAKAMSDLHHHIDKTSLKMAVSDNSTVAARRLDIEPLAEELENISVYDVIHDFLLRLRVVSSLFFHIGSRALLARG